MSPLPLTFGLAALALALFGVRELGWGGSADGGDLPAGDRPGQHRQSDGWGVGETRESRRRASAGGMRFVGAAVGTVFGFSFSQVLPGRLGPLVLAGFVLGGFFLPDLVRTRAARARHRRMIASLPDALDLLAVSVSTGRGLAGSLADLTGSGRGPLVEELARTGEDITWGAGQSAALAALRERIGGSEITAFCATLERSHRLGSPLADQLRRQSATLRQDQRRAIEEEAARAAPKIQLVIALILVPSVLLLMVAALIANADTLLPTGI